MTPYSILYPSFALFALYIIVSFVLMFARLGAMRSKKVTMQDFKLDPTQVAPECTATPVRNYINLFEAPVLFHLVLILIFITQKSDLLFISLAWIYVGLRCLHSLVHLTFNNVTVRFLFFLTSNLVLMALWGRLASFLL